MDKEMSEIMRSFNKGRNSKSKLMKQSRAENAKKAVHSIIPKSILNYSPSKENESSMPIKLRMTEGYREWEYKDSVMRCYFAGGFWIDAQGFYPVWALWNHTEDTLTQIVPLKVLHDDQGQYVEVKVKGVKKKTYIADAITKLYFNVKPDSSNQVNTPPDGSTQVSPETSLSKKPNTTKVSFNNLQYSFYYDPIKSNERPFWVSETGGQAAYIYFDWNAHVFKSGKSYQTYPHPISKRICVNVKQSDGKWKEYDVATVVCTVFNGNPTFPDFIVKFKDGDISNCDADNLYWDLP